MENPADSTKDAWFLERPSFSVSPPPPLRPTHRGLYKGGRRGPGRDCVCTNTRARWRARELRGGSSLVILSLSTINLEAWFSSLGTEERNRGRPAGASEWKDPGPGIAGIKDALWLLPKRSVEWRDKTSAWVLRSLSDRSARAPTAHTVGFSPGCFMANDTCFIVSSFNYQRAPTTPRHSVTYCHWPI